MPPPLRGMYRLALGACQKQRPTEVGLKTSHRIAISVCATASREDFSLMLSHCRYASNLSQIRSECSQAQAVQGSFLDLQKVGIINHTLIINTLSLCVLFPEQ